MADGEWVGEVKNGVKMRIGTGGIGILMCVTVLLCGSARGADDVITDAGEAVSAGVASTISPGAAIGFGSATFENFNEGMNFVSSFIDPASGITFSNSTFGNFVIEYGNDSSWPAAMFQNNKYLVAGGYAPGNGASLPGKFGFTATLPELARSVEMDVAGSSDASTPYTVTLVVENSLGATVGSQTASFTPAAPQEIHLTASSANLDIAQFMVVPGTGGFDGVDNINEIVPEPGVGVAAMIGSIALWRRRGHPVNLWGQSMTCEIQ